MEWHEVTDEQDSLPAIAADPHKLATVLAMKDRRAEELRGHLDELHAQLDAAHSRRTTMFYTLGGAALLNVLTALHNLGIFDALV